MVQTILPLEPYDPADTIYTEHRVFFIEIEIYTRLYYVFVAMSQGLS